MTLSGDQGRTTIHRMDTSKSKDSWALANGLKTSNAATKYHRSNSYGAVERKTTIVQANHDCDCCYAPYRRRERYCREPTKAFQTQRPVCICYDRGQSNAKRYAAFMQHAYDENEVVAGEGYAISGDSFDPSISSSSNAERHREQHEEVDYESSMPNRPAHYMYGEDTSSDLGNGFENLAND